MNDFILALVRTRVRLPPGPPNIAGVTQLVEYLVANQIVVGSSPITRSFFKLGGKMKNLLNMKWFTAFSCVFNIAVLVAAYTMGAWGLFVGCSLFAGVTGYSFWCQMGEE